MDQQSTPRLQFAGIPTNCGPACAKRGECAGSRKKWWASYGDHAKASQPSLDERQPIRWAAANVFMHATTSRQSVYALFTRHSFSARAYDLGSARDAQPNLTEGRPRTDEPQSIRRDGHTPISQISPLKGSLQRVNAKPVGRLIVLSPHRFVLSPHRFLV